MAESMADSVARISWFKTVSGSVLSEASGLFHKWQLQTSQWSLC